MPSHQLGAGFTDPVHDAQHAFRQVLDALSRPGKRVTLGRPIHNLALGPAMAHLLLTLTDDDTSVWWQRSDNAAADWLRFHTGAPLSMLPELAAFAVLTDAQNMPPLDSFACGSMASPEQAATLLIEVSSFDAGPLVEWQGPGIQEMAAVRVAGLPENFWIQWQARHVLFPQGVDIVLTCGDEVLGLPRTIRVRRLEGI